MICEAGLNLGEFSGSGVERGQKKSQWRYLRRLSKGTNLFRVICELRAKLKVKVKSRIYSSCKSVSFPVPSLYLLLIP